MPRLIHGRYRILEEIGSGGEGRVVRALDKQHDRVVALKIRPVGNASRRDDILRDARILLSLQPHAGLPVVRDDFFDSDEYVVAMDWVDGTDLARLVAERGNPGLPPSSVLRYLAQAAEALTHLHTNDPPVIHGDIKPANLVLSHGGRVVLVDFGVSSSPLATSKRAGTPGFVAPEVAAGDAPTRASDVYSLAATAYALLTGSPPAGERASVRGERAAAIESAIRLGLSTDPSRRPGSAGELVERMRAGWETDLPSGVLTFCLTDIEGSTSLWDNRADDMARALVRHDTIVADAVEQRAGRLIRSMGEGDSTFSVFQDASAAVRSMIDLVKRLERERWPGGIELRVRAGVHTGEAELRGGDYFGTTINRAARLRGLADGGQIFLSQVTADLVAKRPGRKIALVDLGRHTLRGLQRAENVYAVAAPGLRTPPSPAVCPFRGLLAFGADDARFFFGRESVVAELNERLARTSFVAVVGASGSGKSSVVGAGLKAPKTITPGAQPMKELRSAGRSRVLVVDQFEELFTLCPDHKQRERFVDALLSRTGSVVIALRADFYGEVAAYPNLARAIAGNQVLLGPMQQDELRRAVEAPAEQVGLRFEPGLVDAILRDVADQPGALPLLEHALLETWERRDGRTLTIESYEASGGVRGAIAHTADLEYEDLDETGRNIVRRIFLRLTQLGEGTEDTRRRAERTELRWADVAQAQVDAVLDRLTGARLIMVDEGTVEVAHEALIREWPRLRAWLAEDREGLRIHRHLSDAARAWDTMQRDRGELYRGARLAGALEWTGADLNPVESSFLDASRAEAEREQLAQARANRRLRMLLAGAASLLVLALIAGSVAVVQRGSARRAATKATVSKLAAQSREVSAKSPALSLLLAAEAHRHVDSVESRGAVLGALASHPRLVTQLYGVTSNVNSTMFSPNGKLLAAVSDNEALFYDAVTHKRAGPALHANGHRWFGGTFSPDGKTIALSSYLGFVELFDVATGRSIGRLDSPDKESLAGVRFSPDGRIAVAGRVDFGRVTFFDMRARRAIGAPLQIRPDDFGGTHVYAFSHDGRTIAVAGAPGLVNLWDVRTRKVVLSLDIGTDVFADGIEYIPGRNVVVVAGSDGTLTQWDLGSRKRVAKPMTVGNVAASAPSVSPDGRFVTTSTDDGRTFVFELATGVQFGPVLEADTQPNPETSWSPDGKLLATAHSRWVALWDMTGKQALGRPLGGGHDTVLGVAISPDGKTLAMGEPEGRIALRDVATQRDLGELHASGHVLAVAFSPDSKLLASVGQESKVRLWNVAERTSAAAIHLGDTWAWAVAFSPNGKLVAVGTDPNSQRNWFTPDREGAAVLFDTTTHKRVGSPMVPGKGNFSVQAVAFSPDGKLLATGSYYYRTQLWDVATQRKQGRPMDVSDEVTLSLAFSRDGKTVAVGGASGVVRIWSVATQRPAIAPLEGQSTPATGLGFSRNGRYLADTTIAGGVRIWDAATGVPYGDQQLTGSDKPASSKPSFDIPTPVSAAFSPDSRSLVTGGTDTMPMLWRIDPASWATTACAVAGRNMTREEWRRYLPGERYHRTCSAWR